MDWKAVLLVGGWVIPALAGGAIGRALEKRPKLFSFLQASSAVTLPNQKPALTVHTHTVVVRNAGSKAATNIRLAHYQLPAFSVTPSIAFHRNTLPTGEEEIVFPTLPPRTQVAVNYVYFPPLIWTQVHAGIHSDDGQPTLIQALVQPRPPIALRVALWALIGVGAVTSVFLLYSAAVWLVGH